MLDEAIEFGARIGDLMGLALATKNKGWIAARRGDWMLALQAAVDTSEQKLQLEDAIDLYTTFHLAGATFCGLGSFAPAAVLIEAGDGPSRSRTHRGFGAARTTAEAKLVDELGEEQLRETPGARRIARSEGNRGLHPRRGRAGAQQGSIGQNPIGLGDELHKNRQWRRLHPESGDNAAAGGRVNRRVGPHLAVVLHDHVRHRCRRDIHPMEPSRLRPRKRHWSGHAFLHFFYTAGRYCVVQRVMDR